MKRLIKKGFVLMIGLLFTLSVFSSAVDAAANANPTWHVDKRVIYHRQASPYDYYGAKDPTIVYYGGKYHVFYTGANQSGGWQMLYTSASTISGLQNASRTYMSKIGESYFCAPEVFYYEPQGLWYLVYQDGTYGAAYSTTTNIADPNSWSGPKSFGISGNMGWDYYIVCDDSYAYMYNTPDNGSGNLYMRKTSLANFPKGWSSPTVAISNSFEGSHVYKSLADGKYYLIIEDMKDGRYYELWSSSNAGGPWTQVAEKWAWRGNLVYDADQWTTNVSHGELIRAGYNQKMEINDINKVDFLIQGTTSLSGEYQKIIWDLGIIRNYTGSSVTPTPTPKPTATPTPKPTATPTPKPTATPTPKPTATPTLSPTTPAPTGTATPTPAPTKDGGLKVQFYNSNTAAANNTIYTNFNVVNTGTTDIKLSDVKIRYYFTNDGSQTDSFACDWAAAGNGNITGAFKTIDKTDADRYLEISFTSDAGTLAAGASTEVKGRCWKSDWSNFTQTNDYSFNSTATSYVDATKVTGYLAGVLKWGTEP